MAQFSEDHIFDYLGEHTKDIGAALELYRASQIIVHPEETILKKQNLWTSHFLKQELSNGSIVEDKLYKYIGQEVVFYNMLLSLSTDVLFLLTMTSCSYSQCSSLQISPSLLIQVNEALKYPYYANLERLSSRRAIEHYNIDSTKILKTSYR